LKDDPVLANDPRRNNNFNYTHPGKDFISNQEDCPFSAHVRKTRPRADLGTATNPENIPNHIIRAGIPYGPEGVQSLLVQCSKGISDLFHSL
jgi:deferrochelatase/peroxidase EfeB